MKLSNFSRFLLGGASLAMIATYFLPLWQIQLWAPQYPEGLNMKIWHNRLSGAFDIINGLNHYIGMREIKAEMFPEFQYIGILLGIFILMGLLTAVVGSLRLLWAFVGMAVAYGAAALWDFYRWGYDYGHNLDPHAAIIVPGMAYQPPVIGYKNLLNFTAYSGPDLGGWVIIAVGLIAVGLLAFEGYSARKQARAAVTPLAGTVLLGLSFMLFQSCKTPGPEPIRYGQDACHACKMTLTDKRFGAEIVTKTGKVYKFDDLNCLDGHLRAGAVEPAQVAGRYAVDFLHVNSFVPLEQAFLLRSEAIRSPMRSDLAVFRSAAARDSVRARSGGEALDWPTAQRSF
ncbi:MAG: hypothetical protein NW241_13165 [Bacteroidia bacterium]|nr:hypothetical protein [Bacteroidia bacterium]